MIYGTLLYGATAQLPPASPWTATKKKTVRRARQLLSTLYGMLVAHHRNLWSTHNQVSGPSYYGDHLLYQRLYEEVEDQIDDLAETLVAYLGPKIVDNVDVISTARSTLEDWSTITNPHQRALRATQDVISHVRNTYDQVKKDGAMTLALDDQLMEISSQNNKALYLIQQRLQPSP